MKDRTVKYPHEQKANQIFQCGGHAEMGRCGYALGVRHCVQRGGRKMQLEEQ